MWHLLTAHQQESFLPFSSWQSLSCCLSPVAKRSTPKPPGSPSSPPKPRVPLYSVRQSCMVLSPPSEPHGPLFGCVPRFKSQRPSFSAAPFPTPPTISYTCQHPRFLPALLGCYSKSGQVWPDGMEPIFSKLSHRLCNQGELLPSYILGGIHSHPPGSKHALSYLTYL